jgi:hypothetical protein
LHELYGLILVQEINEYVHLGDLSRPGLLTTTVVRFIGAVFKAESYAKDITEHIEAVRRRSAAFEQCARRCSYAVIADTRDTTKKISSDVQQSHLFIARGLGNLEQEQNKQNKLISYGFECGQQYVKDMEKRVTQQVTATVNSTLTKFFASHSRVEYHTQNRKSFAGMKPDWARELRGDEKVRRENLPPPDHKRLQSKSQSHCC